MFLRLFGRRQRDCSEGACRDEFDTSFRPGSFKFPLCEHVCAGDQMSDGCARIKSARDDSVTRQQEDEGLAVQQNTIR